MICQNPYNTKIRLQLKKQLAMLVRLSITLLRKQDIFRVNIIYLTNMLNSIGIYWLFIASYYRLLSADTKMKNFRIKTSFGSPEWTKPGLTKLVFLKRKKRFWCFRLNLYLV